MIKKSPLDIAMQFANVYRRSLEQSGTSQLLPLGGVINISYDGVNRFLQRETFSSRDLYHEVEDALIL